MRVLLDTHTFAWWTLEDRNLSDKARNAIFQADDVYISAISGFEMATKYRLGKWPDVGPILGRLEDIVREEGFHFLDMTLRQAQAAGSFRMVHRDPFDRLLAAQAEIENLTLVTRDPAFASFGVSTIW